MLHGWPSMKKRTRKISSTVSRPLTEQDLHAAQGGNGYSWFLLGGPLGFVAGVMWNAVAKELAEQTHEA
jgi:hypothetical protein